MFWNKKKNDPREKSLKEEVIDLLKDLRSKEETLTIKWDAGGDNTLVNFYLNNITPVYDKYDNSVFHKLRDHIIDKFELPNAGEYYNDGEAKLLLDENDEVLITYSEIAYYDDYDNEVDEIDDIVVEHSLKIDFDKFSSLNFFGEFSSFPTKSEDYFRIQQEFSISAALEKELKELIKDQFYKNPILTQDLISISFGGEINETQIIINDISYYKHVVEKDNVNKTEPLF
ncbi:hypothetical protein [Chondrinema litorale]|uniref:hypothetical protein n=1 Tax=Chondrinema litorale TaxID=2994555 RepID=UPI00254338E2|nr:hypothetical protein [Chondrinema litorale]UZR98165.1 hypothetical protein OQ292_29645 [Chondrinema litorale]